MLRIDRIRRRSAGNLTLGSAATLLAALALAGCESSPTGPEEGGQISTTPPLDPGSRTIAEVVVTPRTAALTIGESVRLQAETLDGTGRATRVDSRQITWSTSDAAIAELGPNGHVIAIEEGVATITARIGGKSGQARIIVRAELLEDDDCSRNGRPIPC